MNVRQSCMPEVYTFNCHPIENHVELEGVLTCLGLERHGQSLLRGD